MSHVMHTYKRLPVTFERGEGCWLWDKQGKRYLDALAGIAVCGVGYSHPRLVKAISEQAARLVHTSNLYEIERQEQLGERLAALSGMDEVFFCNSGCEANEAAIKVARLYGHGKGIDAPAIIVLEKAFHGRTIATLSATGSRKVQAGFEPLVPGFIHHHQPHAFKDVFAHLPVAEASEAASRLAADLVGRMVENEDPETVAAIIVEPMSISAAGFVVPHDAYYRRLREICDKHHVLLIYDEIITGFGRLGEWFGANFYGVAPDLLCVGKGMGGGYVPISAVIVAGQVWEAFLGDPAERREFHHGHTFAGNPVASAAGCAAIDEMEARDLPGNAKAQGAYVRSQIGRAHV